MDVFRELGGVATGNGTAINSLPAGFVGSKINPLPVTGPVRPNEEREIGDQFYGLSLGHIGNPYFKVVMKGIKRDLVSIRRPLRTSAHITGIRDLDQIAAILIADPDTLYAGALRHEDNALSVGRVLGVMLRARRRDNFHRWNFGVKQVPAPQTLCKQRGAICKFAGLGRNRRARTYEAKLPRGTTPSRDFKEFIGCVVSPPGINESLIIGRPRQPGWHSFPKWRNYLRLAVRDRKEIERSIDVVSKTPVGKILAVVGERRQMFLKAGRIVRNLLDCEGLRREEINPHTVHAGGQVFEGYPFAVWRPADPRTFKLPGRA